MRNKGNEVFRALVGLCESKFSAARHHVFGGLIQVDDDGSRFPWRKDARG